MPADRGSVAAAAVALLLAAAVAAGQSRGHERAPTPNAAAATRLLDVPFLPQTEDLCGGAALAMTLRYWGERDVHPEDFASLVDRSASGIHTDVLAAAPRQRGWRSFSIAADADGEWVRQQVDHGRPVVALIQVRPGRYHYVVIVAWTSAHVVAHDPARAPFRVLSRAAFDRAWAETGRWALLVLPPADRTPTMSGTDAPEEEVTSAPATVGDTGARTDGCSALVDEMVALAQAGSIDEAEAGLVAAVSMCPVNAGALRALAGIRFLQSRWADAGTFAERASSLDPDDVNGWDLLATSRFLDDRPEAALEAWNRIGRPQVDLVTVTGVSRTRHPVIASVIGVPPRSLLTAATFGRAARRLAELPAARRTRLDYRPIDGGRVELDVSMVERPLVPHGIVPVAAMGARALFDRELTVPVAAPTGTGELWTLAWRWWEARPRIGVALAWPKVVPWLPGVLTIEGSWERPSYATTPFDASAPGPIQRDEHRRATVRLADWATRRVRWEAGTALDRWGPHRHLAVEGALDVRLADDHLSLSGRAGAWAPLGSGERFLSAGVSSAWRSTRELDHPAWTMAAGFDTASAAAPLDLWPGAGTGHARVPLLRAHPLLDEGVVSGEVFGQRLLHGSIEYQHPLVTLPGASLRLAGFADTARAWRRPGRGAPSRVHADLGVGMRVTLPGRGGTLRIDLARGLRDGRMVLSSGWQTPWPFR